MTRHRPEISGRPTPRSDAGGALIMTVVSVLLIMAMAAVTMTVVTSHGREQANSFDRLRCLYAAETAIEMANYDLNIGGEGVVGTEIEPVTVGGSDVWVEATENSDGSITLVARAQLNQIEQVVTAVTESTNEVFDHAMFAGNSSGDPDYELDLSGSGKNADEINGDVYSGMHLTVRDDATISGSVRVKGIAVGVDAETDASQPIPDLAAMNYPVNNDVDVAAEFAANEYWTEFGREGHGWQVPATSPAHVFRRNPEQRSSLNAGTAKDDFYFEDPYEDQDVDRDQDGSDASQISFGTGDGATQQKKVFYIDGNLWVHNLTTYSFQLAALSGGSQVTIVVSGNIYIADNIFYGDDSKDGLALIALKDPDVADSGNIYFGDPNAGTLVTMNAFMYAENNFYDNNLQAGGSTTVTLNGTMSAGNQVLIDRDHDSHHTKLTINYDNRINDGSLAMPGVPNRDAYALEFTIRSWRRHSGAAE